jgi:hypothetical protein
LARSRRGEGPVAEVSPPLLSHHLKVLRDVGVTAVELNDLGLAGSSLHPLIRSSFPDHLGTLNSGRGALG